MEAILALILAGTIVRTDGMWGATRVAVLVVGVYAILFDFTPLRYALGPAERWVFTGMLLLWLANVIVTHRRRAA